MKTSKVLYTRGAITITENTIFYPLCIIVGTPLIWFFTKSLGFNIPIWSNFCYMFFCDTSLKVFKIRGVKTLQVIFISSAIMVAAVMVFDNNMFRSISAIIIFMIYKNAYSQRLGPYAFGYINLAILSGSPYMGIVDKDTWNAILEIFRTGIQSFIGFIFALLFVLLYNYMKQLVFRRKYV